MSLAQYFWGAVLDLVEDFGALGDPVIPEVIDTDSDSTLSCASADLQLPTEQDSSPDGQHAGTVAWIKPQHLDGVRNSESRDGNAEEVTTSEESGLDSNDDTDLRGPNSELQQENLGLLTEKGTAKIKIHHIDKDVSGQIQTLQQNNVYHFKWQDRASMTIKEMIEDADTRKHKTKAADKATVRARAVMQQQIDNCKVRSERLEQEKFRTSGENARSIDEHESNLQEVKGELETQKEAAEQAAAAAEQQITEVQAKHTEDMSTARTKIEELRATQTFTFGCQREANELREQLSQAKDENTKELATKDTEIKTLQTRIDDRDSEIRRTRTEAEGDRKAKMEAIREKNSLYRTKLAADREAKKLKAENESLESKLEKETSRALRAEGCAKGLRDQLVVTKKRAEQWETLYNKTEENARNEILSAYDVVTTQSPEEDQQATTPSSENEELLVLVEKLREENGEFQERNRCLTADIKVWNRVWEKAAKSQKIWEQDMRRYFEQDKQEALTTERANGYANNGQDAREQGIRRQCEEAKQKALTGERENCRVEWESQKCSLNAQFAAKFRSHADRRMQKLRGKARVAHKKMKVKKCQVKWEFRRAVSHAVEVERSLLLTQFRNQFQTEVSNHKTKYESEHASSQSQAETQNDIGSTHRLLFHDEAIKKEELKNALDAKRESEDVLKTVRAENERLSRDLMSYESQKAMTKQTHSEAQTALRAQELVRALKLFTEIATLGLDEKHRNLLNNLLLANKVVRDIRSTIEDGDSVDYDEFQHRLDRVIASSDDFDNLDPRERPALHAQLGETYSVIGGLTTILMGERGESTRQDILERIYSDHVKGKGKQGAVVGSGAASGPSFGAHGGVNAAPLPQLNGNGPFTSAPNGSLQTAFSNTFTPQGTRNASGNPITGMQPFHTAPTPNAAESHDGPEYMDPATAHALQGTEETNQGTSDPFDLDAIDWSDTAWLDFNPDATWPTLDS